MDYEDYENILQALVKKELSSYKTFDYMTDVCEEECSQFIPTRNENTSFVASPCGKKKRRLVSSLAEDKIDSKSTHSSLAERTEHTSNSVTEIRTRKFWRETMCSWSYRVIDHFDLRRELVGIAMSYLDRYMITLSNPSIVDKYQYQLISMTCLYLAIKLYEFKHIGIPGSCSTMDTIRHLSQGNYTLKQMEEMEIDIMHRLAWHLHPPTPQTFIDLLLDSETSELSDLGNFLVELAAIDYFFVSYRPSEIAAAAILNAMDQLYGAVRPLTMSPVIQRLQVFETSRVHECKTRLCLAYQHLGDTDESQWQRSEAGNRSPVTVTTSFF